jgi:hypothetical protein
MEFELFLFKCGFVKGSKDYVELLKVLDDAVEEAPVQYASRGFREHTDKDLGLVDASGGRNKTNNGSDAERLKGMFSWNDTPEVPIVTKSNATIEDLDLSFMNASKAKKEPPVVIQPEEKTEKVQPIESRQSVAKPQPASTTASTESLKPNRKKLPPVQPPSRRRVQIKPPNINIERQVLAPQVFDVTGLINNAMTIDSNKPKWISKSTRRRMPPSCVFALLNPRLGQPTTEQSAANQNVPLPPTHPLTVLETSLQSQDPNTIPVEAKRPLSRSPSNIDMRQHSQPSPTNNSRSQSHHSPHPLQPLQPVQHIIELNLSLPPHTSSVPQTPALRNSTIHHHDPNLHQNHPAHNANLRAGPPTIIKSRSKQDIFSSSNGGRQSSNNNSIRASTNHKNQLTAPSKISAQTASSFHELRAESGLSPNSRALDVSKSGDLLTADKSKSVAGRSRSSTALNGLPLPNVPGGSAKRGNSARKSRVQVAEMVS